ncbi:MAG: hypothetical protein H3Z50_08255 [archaeon]|nr:hypothetical protein [archaeon]
MIISAWLISNSRGQTGAISQLVLNVDGRTFSSQVVTFRYRPNDSISWVSRGKPKVREDWRLESKSNGTIMHIDFAIELDGWPIRRYFFKVLRQKKVENNLDRMLVRLKETVESTSQN